MSILENASEHLRHHYEIEEQTLQQLCTLEEEFRDYNALIKNELVQQKEWITRMHILSQRYILIENTGPCCDHPDVYPATTQDCLLQEMAEKIKNLRNSNCRLYGAVKVLRKSCSVFEELCDQLDMSVESPLIVGDTFHKPISFFIELVSDLFKYFHAWVLKLKYLAHLIEPTNIEAVNRYKEALEVSEDFDEYLNVGLTYCKCLRPKPVC